MIATVLHALHRLRVKRGDEGYGGVVTEGVASSADGATAKAEAALQATVQRLTAQPPPLLAPTRQPEPIERCPWTLVQTRDQLASLAALLSSQARFALDVEHHAQHSYSGLTCLVQISTGEQDFVLDALALGASMALLGPVLSNPAICKVVHGGGNDVTWLHRDFGLLLVNVFDTEKACQSLGFQQRSLAWLLAQYCGVDADKSLQQADWRQRPLPEALLRYARTDVHYLLYIADRLGSELAQRDAQQAQHAQQEQQQQQGRGSPAGAGMAGPAGAAPDASAGGDGSRRRSSGGEVAAGEGLSDSSATFLPASPSAPAPPAPLFQEVPPGSRLWHAVHRSQALSLNLYRPAAPRAAAELAALGVMRCHVSELRSVGQLARPEGVGSGGEALAAEGAAGSEAASGLNAEERREVEVVGDCVFALCEWRDALARALDEGPQCVLPDPVLLQLARAPPLIPQQLRQAVLAAAAAGAEDPLAEPQAQGQTQPQRQLQTQQQPGKQSGGSAAMPLPSCPPSAQATDAAAAPAPAAALANGFLGSPLGEAPPHGAPQPTPPLAPLPSHRAYPQACHFPEALLAEATAVAALLREAAAGQRPWVCAELSALVAPAGASGAAAAARKRHQDPAAFRESLARRFSAKKAVYENCVMLSRAGDLLCYSDRKKLEWYLAKGIAVKVADEPLTVQLTFQHNTTDQSRGTNEYYQAAKTNQCVACGEGGHYLRYRVVPACYRRAMPVHLKSHRSHDVVLLCVTCHEVAHGAAEKLKKRIAAEHGVPLFPPLAGIQSSQQQQQQQQQQQPSQCGTAVDGNGNGGGAGGAVASAAMGRREEGPHPYHVRQAALALERHGPSMPPSRRRELEGIIVAYLGRSRPAAAADAELAPGEAAGSAAEAAAEAAAEGQAAATTAQAAAAAAAGETLRPGEPHPHPCPSASTPPPATAEPGPGLSELDLARGLLAGLSIRTRRKLLRSWRAAGRDLPPELLGEVGEEASEGAGEGAGLGENGALERALGGGGEGGPAAVAAGAAGAAAGAAGVEGGAGGGSSGAEPADNGSGSRGSRPSAGASARAAGHEWHGQQVVEAISQASGDAGLVHLCQRFRQCFVDSLRPKHLPPGWRVEHAAARDFVEHSIYHSSGQKSMK